MTAFQRVLSRVQRPACVLLALVLLGLGYRSTVSYLGSLFDRGGTPESLNESMRLGSQDRLPKPSRQQFSTSMDCLRESRLRQGQKPPDPVEAPAQSSNLRLTPMARRSALEPFTDRTTDPRYLRPHEAVAQSPLSPPL